MKYIVSVFTALIGSITGIVIALIQKDVSPLFVGIGGVVFIAVIFTLITRMGANHYTKGASFEKQIELLKKHEVFFQLRKWIDFEIDKVINIPRCEKREWNTRKYLKVMLGAILKGLNEEIDKFEKTKKANDYVYWHNFIFNVLREGHRKEAEKEGVCIDFINIFQTEFYRFTELLTIEGIAIVIDNPLFGDVEKMSAILDRFSWTLREIQNDISKIIVMNGRVDKILENWVKR